jgi:hypothetical protein
MTRLKTGRVGVCHLHVAHASHAIGEFPCWYELGTKNQSIEDIFGNLLRNHIQCRLVGGLSIYEHMRFGNAVC